jgi:hypothetical protein
MENLHVEIILYVYLNSVADVRTYTTMVKNSFYKELIIFSPYYISFLDALGVK